MLSKEQILFFDTFSGFQASIRALPEDEFARLAAYRTWKTGGKVYRKHKRVFNYLPDAGRDSDDLADRLRGVHIGHIEGSCPDEPEHETVQQAFERFLKVQSRAFGSKRPQLGSKQYDNAFALFLADEIQALYGTNDIKLHILQDLCRDAQIELVPNTKTACKKALEARHINIFDFLNCKRRGTEVEPVFYDYSKFRKYTVGRGLIFKKTWAKASPVLRFLLEIIFYTGS